MKAKAISVRKGKATKANKKKIIAKKELPGYSLSFNKQTTITTTEIMHESGKNRLVSGTITNKLYVCQCAFGLYTERSSFGTNSIHPHNLIMPMDLIYV